MLALDTKNTKQTHGVASLSNRRNVKAAAGSYGVHTRSASEQEILEMTLQKLQRQEGCQCLMCKANCATPAPPPPDYQ